MTDPIKSFIVRGAVRGYLSSHRVEDRAHLAAIKDRKICRRLGGGAYSDARVFAVHASGSMTGPYPTPEYLADR